MHIIANGSRLELELTEAGALELIEKLSKAVRHSQKVGGAWFAEGLTVENTTGQQAAGRITVRVERCPQ